MPNEKKSITVKIIELLGSTFHNHTRKKIEGINKAFKKREEETKECS